MAYLHATFDTDHRSVTCSSITVVLRQISCPVRVSEVFVVVAIQPLASKHNLYAKLNCSHVLTYRAQVDLQKSLI